MNAQEIDYEKLSGMIAQKIVDISGEEKRIWKVEDCAQYLDISDKYFRDTICKKPSFPKPISGFKNKWLRTDVVKWVKKKLPE